MSKKRKKKQHHDEHVDESWLVPYADVLTLLLALFIVLYGMSSVDAKKFAAVADAFNREFQGGTGLFQYPSPLPTPSNESADFDSRNENEDDNNQQKENEGLTEEEIEELQKLQEQKELAIIQEKVNSYIDQNDLENQLNTELTGEGLQVSISDNVLFASGSAEVREKDKKLVSEIAHLLVMDPPRNVIISGHTDNVPIQNSNFSSNWELSVTRALNFMKLLLANEKLDPKTFSAKGFGEFHPVATNDTKEGRQKNRRVEILIQPRTSE